MLKAIIKNRITDHDGQLNVYDFMRSAEIREYMRENKSFDVQEKIYIILKSMTPFEIKLEALKLLSRDNRIKEKERRHILYVIRYVERILQEIYSPESTTMIAMNECYCAETDGLNEYEASVIERNCTRYFASYQELIQYYDGFVPGEDEPLSRCEVDVVYPGKTDKDNNPISFSATWFDGKLEIYAITVDPDWGKMRCFSKDVTEYFYNTMMSRYSLPFPTMSRVKIQTPFMSKPLVGILNSSMDCVGCWYHFFSPEDKRGLAGNFMDFSYQEVDTTSDFMVFDCVSSAEGKVSAEEISEIRYHEKRIMIEDLKPDEQVLIMGRINQITKVERCGWRGYGRIFYVEVEDSSGKIVLPIKVSSDDMKWLEHAAVNHRFLWTEVSTKCDEDGLLCIENTGETALISEAVYEKYMLAT